MALAAITDGNTVTVMQNLKATPIKEKLVIKTVSETLIFATGYAPKEVDYTINGVKYSEVDRPELAPITTANGYNLKRMNMVVFIGKKSNDPLIPSYEMPVNDQLDMLTKLAKTKEDILVEYDAQTATNRWNITSLSFTSTERQSKTNEITRANANIEFTESVGFDTKNLMASPSISIPSHYKVKSNTETYASIAAKYRISKWSTIASIKGNPKKLKAGITIRLK